MKIKTRKTSFIKAKLRKSGGQMNIDKYIKSTAEYHIGAEIWLF